MTLSSWAHAFPMVLAGGLFILIMGLGVVLGGAGFMSFAASGGFTVAALRAKLAA